MGTGVRDGDLQRLKANPPRNLHPKHRKPQPRPACDRWLSREGEIKPARGGCPRLGTGGWGGGGGSLPENQKQLTPSPKDTAWRRPVGKSDGFAFRCANPEFGKFYRPRLGIPRPAGPRDPPFPPAPEHRNALSDVSRPHHRGWPCSVTPRRCPVPSGWGETAPGTWERSRASTPPRRLALGEMLGFSEDRGEVRTLRSSGPESAEPVPGESYLLGGRASLRAVGTLPAAAHLGPRAHRLPAASLLLRAPRGTHARTPAATPPPPSRPSLNPARLIAFF